MQHAGIPSVHDNSLPGLRQSRPRALPFDGRLRHCTLLGVPIRVVSGCPQQPDAGGGVRQPERDAAGQLSAETQPAARTEVPGVCELPAVCLWLGRQIRLLDVGCSDGDLLEAVHANPRFSATGLDLSETNVDYCRSQGYDVLQSDLESAGLPDEEFDVAVALHVVEHLQDPVRTLSEIYRVLRPGQYFFAVMPCVSHIKARLAGRRWKYFGPPAHLWYFSPKTLSRFVERIGFETVYASSLLPPGPRPHLGPQAPDRREGREQATQSNFREVRSDRQRRIRAAFKVGAQETQYALPLFRYNPLLPARDPREVAAQAPPTATGYCVARMQWLFAFSTRRSTPAQWETGRSASSTPAPWPRRRSSCRARVRCARWHR